MMSIYFALIIYGIVGIFIDRKANKAQARIDALQSALVLLEKNTNDKTKELKSKLDALTALKIEDLTAALTAVSDLTPTQKLSRLAKAKQVTNLAFEIVKEFGKLTPLHEKTQKLMLLLLERAEKLAQAQLVAECGKVSFERGGVVRKKQRSEVLPLSFANTFQHRKLHNGVCERLLEKGLILEVLQISSGVKEEDSSVFSFDCYANFSFYSGSKTLGSNVRLYGTVKDWENLILLEVDRILDACKDPEKQTPIK